MTKTRMTIQILTFSSALLALAGVANAGSYGYGNDDNYYEAPPAYHSYQPKHYYKPRHSYNHQYYNNNYNSYNQGYEQNGY